MITEIATLIAGLGGGAIGAGLAFFFNHRWTIFNEDRKAHFEYVSLLRKTQAECEALKNSIIIIKSESLDNLHVPVKRVPLSAITTARLAPANSQKSIDFHQLLSPVELNLNLFNQLLELYRVGNGNGRLQTNQQEQLKATVCGVLASLKLSLIHI